MLLFCAIAGGICSLALFFGKNFQRARFWVSLFGLCCYGLAGTLGIFARKAGTVPLFFLAVATVYLATVVDLFGLEKLLIRALGRSFGCAFFLMGIFQRCPWSYAHAMGIICYARSTYSPVCVFTLIMSPSLMKSGAFTFAPPSTVTDSCRLAPCCRGSPAALRSP